jgi:hypothetical protein
VWGCLPLAHYDDSCLYPSTAALQVPRIKGAVNMIPRPWQWLALGLLSISWPATAYTNTSSMAMLRAQSRLMDDRPDDCPPWYVRQVSMSASLADLGCHLTASTACFRDSTVVSSLNVANTMEPVDARRAGPASSVWNRVRHHQSSVIIYNLHADMYA